MLHSLTCVPEFNVHPTATDGGSGQTSAHVTRKGLVSHHKLLPQTHMRAGGASAGLTLDSDRVLGTMCNFITNAAVSNTIRDIVTKVHTSKCMEITCIYIFTFTNSFKMPVPSPHSCWLHSVKPSCVSVFCLHRWEPVPANSTPGKPAAAPSNDAAGRFYWDTVSRSLFGPKFTSIQT